MALDAAAISLLLNVLTIISMIFAGMRMINSGAARFAKLELKTDTMWDILIKEEIVSARQRGMVQQRSKPQLEGRIASAFGEFGDKIRDFYVQHRLETLSDNELILILAQKFGDELIERISIPFNMNLRGALIAALLFVKGDIGG